VQHKFVPPGQIVTLLYIIDVLQNVQEKLFKKCFENRHNGEWVVITMCPLSLHSLFSVMAKSNIAVFPHPFLFNLDPCTFFVSQR